MKDISENTISTVLKVLLDNLFHAYPSSFNGKILFEENFWDRISLVCCEHYKQSLSKYFWKAAIDIKARGVARLTICQLKIMRLMTYCVYIYFFSRSSWTIEMKMVRISNYMLIESIAGDYWFPMIRTYPRIRVEKCLSDSCFFGHIDRFELSSYYISY